MVDIAAALARAKASIGATDSEPRLGWAWEDPQYRASPTRAFHGQGAALTVNDDGMPALEAAVRALLADQRIRKNWRDEDIWTMVLSLLSTSSSDDSLYLDAAVSRLLKPRAVRVAAALANVRWESEPATLGSLVIARLHAADDVDSLVANLNLDSGKAEALATYSRELLREFDQCVLVTTTTTRQGELAQGDFERAIEDLIGLTLLLSSDLSQHGVYSLRGTTNRPGVRGTTLDRGALGGLLAEKGAGELSARVLSVTDWGACSNFSWHGSEPLPLDRVLDADRRRLISSLLQAQDAIAQRLRVAARWYARAFWADAEDDAALAVAVALDSMLTGKDAVPGAVSKSRFALLERDPADRANRFNRYEEVYQVRSAIAHGGDADRRLARIGGARSMLADAQWVAQRLLDLRLISNPADDRDFRELWAAVQWGTVNWTSTSKT